MSIRALSLNSSPSIIGWGHTPFGKLEGETLESLIIRVTREALAHAQVEARDVDEILLGHFNAGFSAQGFTASLVKQAHPDLRFTPAIRVENACASGSAAVYQGLKTLQAGMGKIVLVVGAEKMTYTPAQEVGINLLKASYLPEDGVNPAGFAGVFGEIASEYFSHFGDQSEALAHIAVKNHANAMHNPYAHMRKELSIEFCRTVSDKNPMVASPLKRSDCSLVSDGAAAIVLAIPDVAKRAPQAARFRAMEHVQDVLPRTGRDVLNYEGPARAWHQALTQAGVTLEDLSCVEVHDCFTIAELLSYEAMRLTPKGQGARAILEGWTLSSGRLPVNLSGGLKAKGHPIGATGVSMHALCAMQVCGQAPLGMQIPNASLAALFNMGGVAVANYVSVLEGR
jgi:acetyl-CoA C-acetyltransferase